MGYLTHIGDSPSVEFVIMKDSLVLRSVSMRRSSVEFENVILENGCGFDFVLHVDIFA